MKHLLTITILIASLSLGVWFGLEASTKPNNTTAQAVFCDVGQGDAILIMHGSWQMLVDAGPSGPKILDCLDKFMPVWDKTIEMVVITHMDHDHIGGFPSVFSEFFVAHTLYEPLPRNTESFSRLLGALLEEKEAGMQETLPHRGLTFTDGNNLTVKVVFPEVGLKPFSSAHLEQAETVLQDAKSNDTVVFESSNDRSIALIVSLYNTDIALTGDLSAEKELAILEVGMIGEVEVLKAGHHGSKTSTHPAFIQATRPENTIISAGKNNRYGHPHSRVIGQLQQAGTQIWRTDLQGHIVVKSTPSGYWLEALSSEQ